MGKKLDKFLLLMWKNWTLQYRRPLQTTVEIAAPILFCSLLVLIRSLVDPVIYPSQTYLPFDTIPPYFSPQRDIINNLSNVTTVFSRYTIVYSPSNEILDRTMTFLKISFGDVKGFKNGKELEHHFLTDEGQYTIAAIQFPDELYNKSEIPQNVEVTLRFPSELRTTQGPMFDAPFHRIENTALKNNENDTESVIDKLNRIFQIRDWKTNLLYQVFETTGPREYNRNNGAAPNYYAEGFLALQVLITNLLIFAQKNMTSFQDMLFLRLSFPVLHMQRFPFASWKEDPLLPALIRFMGMLTMLSFVYTCINIVKVITTEKEKQLKEAMKIMGLPSWLHWVAWFIKCFSFLLISVICIVFLLTTSWYSHSGYSVFTYSNPFILFLFLISYICATITFCFSVSVFFSTANTASAVAGLVWFLSYVPYLFLQSHYEFLSLSTKLVVSLGVNTAVAYGLQIFLMYESTNEGIQWDNIWVPSSTDDNLSLGLIITMLIIDTFLYLIIALYVEAIYPGEYGMPQKWYFPFTYSFWFGKPKKIPISEDVIDHSTLKPNFFETNPENLNVGIQIKNLQKKFKTKVAINNISLKMYEDEITVLLGHNGAGKTTIMSMLTGILPPTSGTAVIKDFDITTNMKEIRANLGFCPQHNILFDDMTVKEHLYFFSRLKGLEKQKIQQEIDKYVKLLDLESKINKKSSTLSGGMQRKLCVGIALCGGSQVVLLDEPTAGMDPSSRRSLWDLLQTQKIGRCILLTTHYMDEADVLGDRIAIMANGEVKCCGSSFFLKKRFGTGYHLILEKSKNCDANKITLLLQKYIPDIKIHRNIGTELAYLLNEEHSPLFEEMLKDLEQNLQALAIRSYGISLTTLEDVFIKMSIDSESENIVNEEIKQSKSKLKIDLSLQRSISDPSKKLTLVTGVELIRNQFIAMFMKKALSFIRRWLLQLIQIIIPVIFLIIAIAVSRNISRYKVKDLPRLPITLDSYLNPVVVVQDEIKNTLSKNYIKMLNNYKMENIENDMIKAMLNFSHLSPISFRRKYIIGGSFTTNGKNSTVVTAWFNNNPYHTPPLALALVLNAIYKTALNENYSISFVNHPLPFTADSKFDRLLRGNSMGFHLAFNIAFSMSFVSSFYILFYVKERHSKSKHLQFASGLKIYILWISAFICDLMTFIVTILALLLTFVCFQEDGFSTFEDLGRMFFILFYFGFAMLPMMYLASYLFSLPATGFTRMTLFSVFTGVAAFLVIQIIATPGFSLQETADGLHLGFLLIPHYSLATGIRDSYTTHATMKMCNFFVNDCLEYSSRTEDECWDLACKNNNSETLNRYCCEREHNYFNWKSPGIGKNILYSFTTGIVLFLLLNIFEYKLLSKAVRLFQTRQREPEYNASDEDQDVVDEKQRIRTLSEAQLLKDNSLVLKNLTKYYRNFLAVDGICLGVKQYECFGLLGLNGAGKTSTFKMITGDTNISSGNAWVHGFNVKTQLTNVQEVIGYCPQFDALLTDLTGKETLVMFGLLRGIPLKDCLYLAETLGQQFDFYQHLNKKIKQMSGGNKRKISTAISLIGDPPLICLDEPTAGMDPVTKRTLWNALCRVRDSGKCILFTSHSMEECEALCTRLAIMVNGAFKCLGSLQHLKNKFAAGYTLTIKMKRDHREAQTFEDVERFVETNFPTAKEQEKHQDLICYYIVDQNLKLSRMFGILEHAKSRLNVEDYSLGQATLEQVFLMLTKYQR